jgi:hypothetical protein
VDILGLFERLTPETAAIEIAAIGIALSKCKTDEEVAFLSGAFLLLADTLGMIVASRALREAREKECEDKQKDPPAKESGK